MSELAKQAKMFLNETRGRIKDFPMEVLLSLTYFVVFVCIENKVGPWSDKAFSFLVWFLPNFSLLHKFGRLSGKHVGYKVAYYASWFLWVPFLLWCTTLPSPIITVSCLLAVMLLIVGNRQMDDHDFGRNVVRFLRDIAISLLPSLLITIVYELIIVSISLLFDFEPGRKVTFYPVLLNFIVITPLVFCIQSTRDDDARTTHTIVGGLVDRIMTPALVVYTLILYVYCVKILLEWKLPRGGVAYLTLGYVGATFACLAVRSATQSRNWSWFYDNFAFLSLPLLVLLWTGTLRRMAEYGLTQDRVYLVIFAVTATLFIVLLTRYRTKILQKIVIVFSALCAFFTYVPWLSADAIGIASQRSRLDERLPLILQNDSFPQSIDYRALAHDTALAETMVSANGAYRYLEENMDKEEFEKLYGRHGEFNFYTWRLTEARQADTLTTEYHRRYELAGEFDLGDYTTLVSNSEWFSRQDVLSFAIYDVASEQLIVRCDIMSRMFDDWADTTNTEQVTDILSYHNDDYLVVFSSISAYISAGATLDSLGNSHFNTYRPTLFRKKKTAQ